MTSRADRIKSMTDDLATYSRGMQSNNAPLCLLIETRYDLAGVSPEQFTTAISGRIMRYKAFEADKVCEPLCNGCRKHPDEIEEYREMATDSDMTPEEFVRLEEGTYNPDNGHFLCTECYIKAGMPSAPGPGWKAP